MIVCHRSGTQQAPVVDAISAKGALRNNLANFLISME
jgi:hypothetical protein